MSQDTSTARRTTEEAAAGTAAGTAPERGAPGGRWRRRTAAATAPASAALRAAAPALLGYAAVRLTGVLVLAWWAHRRGGHLGDLLARSWDSVWYLGIADHGYDTALPAPGPDGKSLSNLAFFPLYPGIVRAVSALTSLSSPTVGLVASWVFSLIAAWGVFAVGRRLHGRRTGVALAVLWGVLPHALTESMAYTEPVFTAFAAWSLRAALDRRWVLAGFLSLLAGLTRPTGAALAAAVALGALAGLRRCAGSRDGAAGADRPAAWRCLLGAVLAPAGWVAYTAWVGVRLHRWDGYFAVQTAWGTTFDGGAFTVHGVVDQFARSERTMLAAAVVTAVLLASLVLLLLCALDRVPPVLLLYCAALLVLTLGTAGFFHAKARFLVPAFPLLLPLARPLALARPAKAAVVLAAAALLSAVYGGHLALVWTHSP
ncbi:hypothetical protein LO771_06505 [Streptacidiphilus sp. ASG 303]|uniref:hypothetical protein n=1 Tax=Streptacidiphilus sp. ASG 303 TaxID=2896847 RepID=UPI001E2BEFA7|nr:hypothetical protein [Streptacidiphilus sp. ASG 303]MCD0482075.1 hypothetical protein [Streptacidiphilus sp. ASG 303]